MNSTRNKSVDLIYLLYNNPHTVFRLRDVALLTGESDPLRLGQRLNYYVRTGRLLNPRKGIYAKEGYNPEERAISCILLRIFRWNMCCKKRALYSSATRG